ncbi:hypothetical protein V8J88_04630 [Massilia sp. W12]|uniref:hypothetical protein n=1 Tax=Massilia sp. W12 TaxID=3126507 RepID=UPI0030CB2FB1
MKTKASQQKIVQAAFVSAFALLTLAWLSGAGVLWQFLAFALPLSAPMIAGLQARRALRKAALARSAIQRRLQPGNQR